MTINLEALEQAFAAVEEIGKGEVTFDVGDTPISLRVILPHEETAVQAWAGEGLTEADEDEATPVGVLHFLDRFKLGTLSYAIIQMGALDLRSVDFVPTGETLPNKKLVKVPRHEAVRKLVARWSSAVRDGVFKKYGELLEEVGAEAEKAIVFKPSDFDGEIERLTARIEELKAQSESEAKSGFADQVKQINEMGDVEPEAETEAPAAEAEATEPESPPVPEPAARRSAIPQAAAPPSPRPAQAPASQTEAKPKKQVPDESIVGPDDMEAAVEAENRRLLEARMQGVRAPIEPSGSAIDASRRPPRRPPHADAQEAAKDIAAMGGAAGQVGDVPAFRMDEPSGEVATAPPAASPAAINTPPQGKRNPRFRPPKT